MSRRALGAFLIALIVVQLAVLFVLPPACAGECSEESGADSCPPVCSLCTNCAHAREARLPVPDLAPPAAGPPTPRDHRDQAPALELTTEIFHPPLLG